MTGVAVNVIHLAVQFTWDPRKAALNAKKHGVTFGEAVTVFADPLAIIIEDGVHTERARIVGHSVLQRVLFVVYVEVLETQIRVISARRTTAHERKRYEKGE